MKITSFDNHNLCFLTGQKTVYLNPLAIVSVENVRYYMDRDNGELWSFSIQTYGGGEHFAFKTESEAEITRMMIIEKAGLADD
jgi:hypothetical protein